MNAEKTVQAILANQETWERYAELIKIEIGVNARRSVALNGLATVKAAKDLNDKVQTLIYGKCLQPEESLDLLSERIELLQEEILLTEQVCCAIVNLSSINFQMNRLIPGVRSSNERMLVHKRSFLARLREIRAAKKELEKERLLAQNECKEAFEPSIKWEQICTVQRPIVWENVPPTFELV